VQAGTVLTVNYVNEINKTFNLNATFAPGERCTSQWWDSVATITELPTHAQMQTMYGDDYRFPSWLLNAAIDRANARRKYGEPEDDD
jgi:hypothetical protein